MYIVNCKPISKPVFVDQDMWEKIVLNLISNAFKYTLHGSIEVTLYETPGQTCVFSVRDTGIGIPSNDLPHLFERFYRVSGNQTGRAIEGTGIGLALVHELVKVHNGTIT